MDLIQRQRSNAPIHNTLSVNRYLATRGTPVFEQALYLFDLAHFDLFLKIKAALKGTQFESMEGAK